ncbi:hypothetical protein R3P38DRAFT_96613 [Favolaschia claudopus]|uniref:Transmembrane protein n=1 Tax=Favolaschia claudopus TaxID=2862362 RepID=A0AAW0D7V3_9AGAR
MAAINPLSGLLESLLQSLSESGTQGHPSPTSEFFSSPSASSTSTTNLQPQTPSSTYPQPSVPSAPIIISHAGKSRALSSGTITGISVAAVIAILGVGTVFWYFRRVRRQRLMRRHRDLEIGPVALTISPFTLLNQNHWQPDALRLETSSVVGSTLARSVLQTELQAATDKVAELEDQERRSEGRAQSTRRRLWRLTSARWRSQSDLEAQLQAAREEISMLVTRINALEANSDFVWGGGGIEEPPPDYATAV